MVVDTHYLTVSERRRVTAAVAGEPRECDDSACRIHAEVIRDVAGEATL